MQMQHLMVGYPKYYQTADYALRLSVMADIATMRMKALHFWDKHGISAASEAFGVSCRTLYWWRQLLNKGGPEGLIPHSKAPLVRRKKHWHPDVLKEIRRLRTKQPNLGKEQIFVRLKPWCAQRHLTIFHMRPEEPAPFTAMSSPNSAYIATKTCKETPAAPSSHLYLTQSTELRITVTTMLFCILLSL